MTQEAPSPLLSWGCAACLPATLCPACPDPSQSSPALAATSNLPCSSSPARGRQWNSQPKEAVYSSWQIPDTGVFPHYQSKQKAGNWNASQQCCLFPVSRGEGAAQPYPSPALKTFLKAQPHPSYSQQHQLCRLALSQGHGFIFLSLAMQSKSHSSKKPQKYGINWDRREDIPFPI